ncbi:MAG TPA: hypothetical protein VNO33_09530 [Kofleriaceae bacterium]|nr:hypothetical protein [Kofleriaceae bacterium]
MRLHHPLAALLLALSPACASEGLGEPRQLQPATSDANFILTVSNQSTAVDPVDIQISVDAAPAVEGDFPSGVDYMFELALNTGQHNIVPVSEQGEAQRVDLFRISDGLNYGVLHFVDATAEIAVPHFTFEVLDDPPAFED